MYFEESNFYGVNLIVKVDWRFFPFYLVFVPRFPLKFFLKNFQLKIYIEKTELFWKINVSGYTFVLGGGGIFSKELLWKIIVGGYKFWGGNFLKGNPLKNLVKVNPLENYHVGEYWGGGIFSSKNKNGWL